MSRSGGYFAKYWGRGGGEILNMYAFGVGIQTLKIRIQASKIRIQALKIRIQALKIQVQAFKIRIQAFKTVADTSRNILSGIYESYLPIFCRIFSISFKNRFKSAVTQTVSYSTLKTRKCITPHFEMW